LDALAAASAGHEEWQEPLARRPVLPPRAAQALAGIVASHLLRTLAQRADLDPSVAAQIAARLNPRMPETAPDMTPGVAMAEAQRLSQAGLLTEQAVLAAVRQGDTHMVSAMLAAAAEVPIETVNRAASLRSAKGLVSLVWQAGFSMRTGTAVQSLLGLLPRGEMLCAGPGGGFPLSVDEMRWQTAFLARDGR
jgi:hypothetical protein